uniref:Uncharacterized protein n=1 Tax=Ananas comosus var. bracteatus TaxID=296719 RepID=A0A6V7PCL9_ANACO|nr:unnamed protein product [Ananas comosus var. bracteatus]
MCSSKSVAPPKTIGVGIGIGIGIWGKAKSRVSKVGDERRGKRGFCGEAGSVHVGAGPEPARSKPADSIVNRVEHGDIYEHVFGLVLLLKIAALSFVDGFDDKFVRLTAEIMMDPPEQEKGEEHNAETSSDELRRIFTSWRQQELLSRLMPTIPIEAQHLLSEVIKTFNERNSSFEEFIFALKSTVGMQLLAEAIGIGKGKTDLTKARSDPSRRNNQTSYTPSEMPIGKACSSLTPKDIIRFLTGGYRISKARSNDLFWEAVWPRLLARGWHSEQPKDQLIAGSKSTLVFLIPGIKKFSRKNTREGTIILILLAQGEGPFKVREMRDFPVDATFKYEPSNHFGKSQSNSSEEQYSSDVSSSGSEVGTDQDISGDGNIAAVSSQTIPICANVPGNPCLDVLNDTSSLKDIKCQLKQRAKSRQQVYLAPVSKRRRLAAANKESAQDEKKREESEKKPLARALFDLNLPYVLPDNETNENLCMPLDNQDEQNKDKGASLGERAKEELSGGQSLLSSQRQSTRTRPPTRRALEALASGLLGQSGEVKE